MQHRPLPLKELKPRRTKYGNRKVAYKGMQFDSILERDRFIVLEEAQTQGRICKLERQVSYDLVVNGKEIARFVPDFRYYVVGNGTVTEDVKSEATMTPLFRLKAKLFAALYYKDIHIVTKHNLHEIPS